MKEIIKQIKDFFGEGFQLSHTHKVVYDLCKKADHYGEIGSQKGCSMIMGALSNPKLRINCFDCPNNGWGGERGTEAILKAAAAKFAEGRSFITFGNSHHKTIKDAMSELGPYDVFLVDGDHSYAGAKEDFATVWPLIKPGGCVIMDDLVHHPELNTLFEDLLVALPGHKFEKYLELSIEEKELGFILRGVGVIWK